MTVAGPTPLWTPQPGPQTAGLHCPVEEIFYGGARGGGKSDWLLGDWLAHEARHTKHAKGILFRRTIVEMEELEARALVLFLRAGATYNKTEHVFTFPSGARLLLRYLEHDSDAMGYQGHQYTWIGVDEAGNFATPVAINLMRATLRSPHGVPCVMRLTGNPGGPGHHWLRGTYILNGPYRIFRYQPQPEEAPNLWVESVFIPAQLEDNPILMQNDPAYEARIAAAGGPQLYRAWRYGDWDAIVGAVFAEWYGPVHVLETFKPPTGWEIVGGLDWGFRAPGCLVLAAVAPAHHGEIADLVVVDEWYFRETVAADVGRGIALMARRWGGVRWIACDTQMWDRVGAGLTVAEECQAAITRALPPGTASVPLIQTTKGPGSRRAKKMLMHQYLRWTPGKDGEVTAWGRPRLRFTRRAKHCIRTIPTLTYPPDRAGVSRDDVDTRLEDHPYDAVTAMLMAHPLAQVEQEPHVEVNRHPGTDPRRRKRRPRWLDRVAAQHPGAGWPDGGVEEWDQPPDPLHFEGLVPYPEGDLL